MQNLKKSIITIINKCNYKFLIYMLIFIITIVLLYGNYNLIEGYGDMTLDESILEKKMKLHEMDKDIKKNTVDNNEKNNNRKMIVMDTEDTINTISENFQNCNSVKNNTLGLNNDDDDPSIIDPAMISESICDLNNNLRANVKI